MELFLAVTTVKMSAQPSSPPSFSPLSVSGSYSHTLVTKRKVIKIAFNAPSERKRRGRGRVKQGSRRGGEKGGNSERWQFLYLLLLFI